MGIPEADVKAIAIQNALNNKYAYPILLEIPRQSKHLAGLSITKIRMIHAEEAQ
jgi:hypothetical protein